MRDRDTQNGARLTLEEYRARLASLTLEAMGTIEAQDLAVALQVEAAAALAVCMHSAPSNVDAMVEAAIDAMAERAATVTS